MADLEASVLRAVGEPRMRFDEDGLRLLRAARFAAQLGFEIEPRDAGRDARARQRPCSGCQRERLGDELRRMFAREPAVSRLRILAETGVLDHALPRARRPARRAAGQDRRATTCGCTAWPRSMPPPTSIRTMTPLRLAALLHDIGKPSTFADGHFVGHDVEGAKLAEALLARLAFPRREIEPVSPLIRNHMFNYEPRWSNAAVRRFIRRVGAIGSMTC